MFRLFSARFRAICVHYVVVCLLLFFVYLLLVHVWYPYGLFELVGGLALFQLIAIIELTVGPLLTYIVFNSNKKSRQLIVDVIVIVIIQVAIFSYGFYSVYVARPVALVFSVDRFEIVTRPDVDSLKVSEFQPFFPGIFSKPEILNVSLPLDVAERNSIMFDVLEQGGVDLHLRPNLYGSFESNTVLAHLRHMDELKIRFKDVSPEQISEIEVFDSESFGWIPSHSYFGFSTAIIDREDGNPVFFIDFDAF